ncbi:MAG TPA: pseudouridine synthase [Bacillota bacterium]
MPLIRLQKVIAEAGVASRRKAEEMMVAGRVTVNGKVTQRLGTRVDPERDEVAVDGLVVGGQPKVVYMLNKPKGHLSTARDDQDRPTVLDLIPGAESRLYPVGRLDLDTEGLVLVTNDGPLAHGLTHPSKEVPKTYVALVRGHPGRTALKTLTAGVDLDDGRTSPAKVRLLGAHGGNALLELTIHEGKKREVRRMCEAVGHEVIELRRTRLGPLALGLLAPGQSRSLTPAELEALRRAAGLIAGEPTPVARMPASGQGNEGVRRRPPGSPPERGRRTRPNEGVPPGPGGYRAAGKIDRKGSGRPAKAGGLRPERTGKAGPVGQPGRTVQSSWAGQPGRTGKPSRTFGQPARSAATGEARPAGPRPVGARPAGRRPVGARPVGRRPAAKPSPAGPGSKGGTRAK